MMSLRTFHILSIEDNEADAFIILEAFKECGHACNLNVVPSYAEAREVLDRDFVDLILSDFGTSTKEAAEFVQHVRRVAPRLPIVILSGLANPNLAYEAGANAFVRKVIDLQQFMAKIKGLTDFWFSIAELPQ